MEIRRQCRRCGCVGGRNGVAVAVPTTAEVLVVSVVLQVSVTLSVSSVSTVFLVILVVSMAVVTVAAVTQLAMTPNLLTIQCMYRSLLSKF